MEHTKNIKLVLFGYILFAIASVYSFAQEFYGMEYPDTFYYANVFMQQGHIEVMYPLTQGVFCLLHRIGDGLIYTKIGNWLAYYLACVILCVGTIKLWPQYKHIALICTSFAVLCLPIYETTACNGNALSSLFLTGVLVTLLYFRDNLLNLKGVILAVCIGMSVLARFPNIVIIPLLVLLMPLICKCRKEYGVYTLALLGGLVFYILVCVLLDHGWYNFLNAFNNNLTVATDTDAMDHSVSFLLGVYLKDLKDIISFMKYLSLITILPILVFSFISRKYIRITLNALFALLFFGYLYKKIGMFKSETWTLQIMLVAILLLFNYILLVLAMARHNVRIAIITALPVVCGLAAMAGSDSGLAYMLPILLASVPLTLSQMKVALQETKPNEKILLIISLIGLSVCAACYVREGMWILGVVGFILMMLTFWSLPYLSIYSKELFCRNHEQQHVSLHWICTIVLVILAWWVIQARFVMSGEDAPLLQSTYAFNESKLRGLHSNKVSVDWVSDVMGKYRGYKDKGASVLFYGYASNIFTYLSDDGKIKNVDFSFRENARNIKAFRIGMETHPEVVFLCAYNPGARVLYTLDSYPQIHSYLMDHGYMCDNNKYYAIYYLK